MFETLKQARIRRHIPELLLLGCLPIISVQSNANAVEHELLYVGPAGASAHLGVLQGIAEANYQGEFMGVSFTLRETTPEDFTADAIGNSMAVFVDADVATYLWVLNSIDIPVLNLTRVDDSLRAACHDNDFHIMPGNRMYRDAEAQWRKKNPASNAIARAWHPDFVKYAARDLNKRFKKEQGVEMNSDSWAGWAAARLVTDSIVRRGIGDPDALLEFLRTDLEFDGQKGTDMSFRKTGQLRQLVLLVEDGRIVGEAPDDTSDMDTIGITECN